MNAILNVKLPCNDDKSNRSQCFVFNRLNQDIHEPFPTDAILMSENIRKGQPQLMEVGIWTKTQEHGRVDIYERELPPRVWGRMLDDVNELGYPRSSCNPLRCRPGQVPVKDENSAKCCTVCFKCAGYANTTAQTCRNCPSGYIPIPDHTRCEPLPEKIPRRLKVGKIIMLAVGAPLLLVVLATCGVTVVERSSSVIKGSDSSLSWITLLAMSFALLSLLLYEPATKTTCHLTRLLTLPWLLVPIAAMLVKMN